MDDSSPERLARAEGPIDQKDEPNAPAPKRRRWRRLGIGLAAVVACLLVVGLLVAYVIEPEYAYQPPADKVLGSDVSHPAPAYDVWGRSISSEEAAELLKEPAGRRLLSASHGAVAIDAELLALGQEAFYTETFGNEMFLSDILGILEGPLTPTAYISALWQLGGEGTTNLKVRLAHAVTVGGRTFEKGELVSTGLDVPRGVYAPLGIKLKITDARLQIGITCAACHSTVDRESGLVVHGAPNNDFNAGLMLALSTNSAAYFTHAKIDSLEDYVGEQSPSITTTGGEPTRLPEVQKLENAVDKILLQWPPGNFDSMTDLAADPAQLPSSFTLGNHPYNWSGGFAAGPFKGLSVQTNNVHALNADTLTQADAAQDLFGIDKEVFLGTMLQNAAREPFRYHPGKHGKPSEFLASIDPTRGGPGLNHVVALPSYPRPTWASPNSLWNSSPGQPLWRQVNAMAAWQNTIVPAEPPIERDAAQAELGRQIFERAECNRCHSGRFLTNNQVVPVAEIDGEPVRARAFSITEGLMAEPVGYGFDTPVPIPDEAQPLPLPTEKLDPQQLKIAWAHGTDGGYKVPALVGLYWSAPYLHDGALAVGADAEAELGVAGTLRSEIPVDPANSLRAVVDRSLRAAVRQANRAAGLDEVNVTGQGHEFWVDAESGYTDAEQAALIHYLLTYRADR